MGLFAYKILILASLDQGIDYLRSSDQEIDYAGALISFGYLIDFLV